jgi:hypothetical protein
LAVFVEILTVDAGCQGVWNQVLFRADQGETVTARPR